MIAGAGVVVVPAYSQQCAETVPEVDRQPRLTFLVEARLHPLCQSMVSGKLVVVVVVVVVPPETWNDQVPLCPSPELEEAEAAAVVAVVVVARMTGSPHDSMAVSLVVSSWVSQFLVLLVQRNSLLSSQPVT